MRDSIITTGVYLVVVLSVGHLLRVAGTPDESSKRLLGYFNRCHKLDLLTHKKCRIL